MMTPGHERLYQRLLWVLPASFRHEAEPELLETFRAAHARAASGHAGARLLFWWRTAADLFVTSRAERRAQRQAAHPPGPPIFSSRNLMNTMQETARAKTIELGKTTGMESAELEILSLQPLSLGLAPAEEEDWGE